MAKKKRFKKATHDLVTQKMLNQRAARSEKAGYAKQKWITYCEIMIDAGFKVYLYEARRTPSKYITVKNYYNKSFKVRFSNHRPIKSREEAGDCDFFVGVCNSVTHTTDQAIAATLQHFDVQSEAAE